MAAIIGVALLLNYSKKRQEITQPLIELVKISPSIENPDLSIANWLNNQLRSTGVDTIYGWGCEFDEINGYVDFKYYINEKKHHHVWTVDRKTKKVSNISRDYKKISSLTENGLLDVPFIDKTLPYNPKYDMNTFRNSDYYRGKGKDPLGKRIDRF